MFLVFTYLLYLFSVAVGLCCCVQAYSSFSEWRLLFVVVYGLLITVESSVVEHGF